jgi:beta-galactosidase
MAVHAPIPDGKREIVSYWGWPEEWQSWNWTGNEGRMLEVRVFTRCPKVRLELNGKVVGEKEAGDSTKLIATFKVPYQPGVLKAVGLEKGIEVVSKVLATTGAPRQIKLTADRQQIRADRNDLSYVKIEIVDEFGNMIPDATIPVKLTVSGEGEIAGVGSACPDCMASFQKPEVTTFRGRALAILRPLPGNRAGNIMLKAEAAGLEAATITIGTYQASPVAFTGNEK